MGMDARGEALRCCDRAEASIAAFCGVMSLRRFATQKQTQHVINGTKRRYQRPLSTTRRKPRYNTSFEPASASNHIQSAQREYHSSKNSTLSLSSATEAPRLSCGGKTKSTCAAAAAGLLLMLLAIENPVVAPFAQKPALAAPLVDGATLFEANCAACHAGGGNILPFARGKTLKTPALKKNKLLDQEALVNFVKDGKGAMPSYSSKLSDDEINSISEFILLRASENWK